MDNISLSIKTTNPSMYSNQSVHIWQPIRPHMKAGSPELRGLQRAEKVLKGKNKNTRVRAARYGAASGGRLFMPLKGRVADLPPWRSTSTPVRPVRLPEQVIRGSRRLEPSRTTETPGAAGKGGLRSNARGRGCSASQAQREGNDTACISYLYFVSYLY